MVQMTSSRNKWFWYCLSFLLHHQSQEFDTDISSASVGHILVHDGSDSFDNVAIIRDISLASNGAVNNRKRCG